MRKADPTQNLSYEGEFLTRANNHAIKRLSRKPDEAYSLRVRPCNYIYYQLLGF